MTADLDALAAQGHELMRAGRFEVLEALMRGATASGQAPLQLWRLLVASVRAQAKPEAALGIQEMLVKALPGDLTLRFDLAEVLLLLGQFDRGWREYRHRYQLPHTASLERKVQKPRWDGRPIPGKTLLIHDEQGFGDTFQFMRLVAAAKAKSQAQVVLEVNHETAGLAQRMGGFDALSVRGALPPPFDQHCELMSLPMAMGLQLSDLPGQVAYLSADPGRVAVWRERLAGAAGLKVALVWAGRPEHLNDVNRSMALAQLAPLAMDGVTFLSIQKGPAASAAAAPPPGMTLVDLGPQIADFEDTAAILSQVDLLISVDSSPVHLAGALGVPTWVMLPFAPDWRWLMDREDSPWYPAARLLRQASYGDWSRPIAQARAALEDEVGRLSVNNA